MAMKSAFDYFEPSDGLIRLETLPQNHYTVYLRKIFSEYDEISFDDFYRVMKPKLISKKVNASFDSVEFENTMTSVACFFWPSREQEDVNISSSQDALLDLFGSKASEEPIPTQPAPQ
jgi:hypothetical protein